MLYAYHSRQDTIPLDFLLIASRISFYPLSVSVLPVSLPGKTKPFFQTVALRIGDDAVVLEPPHHNTWRYALLIRKGFDR